jgi:hypothetical protein
MGRDASGIKAGTRIADALQPTSLHSLPKEAVTMLPVGGIFSTRDEAERARDALCERGVEPEETFIESLNEPFWTNLVDVDLPAEEAQLFEPYLAGSTSFLVVRTAKLSPDEVDDVLEEHKGLIVRMDVQPPLADVPMRESEDR